MTKAFCWLAFATLFVVSAGGWVVAFLVRSAAEFHFLSKGLLMPRVSLLVLMNANWILLTPTPWLMYLCLRSRHKLSVEEALIFSSSAALAATLVSVIVAIASITPWLPLHGRLPP